MRRTNKHHAFNPGIGLKRRGTYNQAIGGILPKNAFRGFPQSFLPHRLGDGNYLHASKHSAHTVTYDNVRTMIWINFVDLGEFLAQSKCGIEDRIAGGIAKDPELIMFADFSVGLKSVDRLRPIERR